MLQESSKFSNLIICFLMARSPRQYERCGLGVLPGWLHLPRCKMLRLVPWLGLGGAGPRPSSTTCITTQHCRCKASSAGALCEHVLPPIVAASAACLWHRLAGAAWESPRAATHASIAACEPLSSLGVPMAGNNKGSPAQPVKQSV